MTQEKFISRVKAIYGDKYDLSKVVYKGVKNEVILIDKCAKKEIVVKPEKILHKQYIRLTNEEKANIFIKKSKEKFGDKFDYSKVEYIDANTPVTLVCKEHGEFNVDMYRHLYSKDGLCPLCNKITINKEKADAFIKKSKEKFGDRFDYSKVVYVNSQTPVTLICKEHGEFNVNMYTHLYSEDGLCPLCCSGLKRVGRRQLSTEQIIKKCKHYYGDKYDYSKIEYKGGGSRKEHVEIICPEHGSFFKCVDNIDKRDCGCPRCAREKKRSNDIISIANKFIERSKNKFGDRFDYSEVEYVNSHTPVTLICKEHGIRFSTTPSNHFSTKFGGCKECHKEYIESTKSKKIRVKLTEEERKERRRECSEKLFIERATRKFGDRFDYSRVKYVDSNTPVNIIDKESNNEMFSIKPISFLQSVHGRPSKFRVTKEKFIERARKFHGDKYDYSKVEYKGDKVKVCIICPIHGEFWQTPHNHLNIIRGGCGCPKCANMVSKLEENVIDGLTKENIKFKKEYTNEKIFGKMRGDFFIKSYNVMIECQGSQHFEENNPLQRSYGGSLSGQIERDYNFNKCCKDANIKLFYYFDEDNTKGVDYLNNKKFNGIYTEKNTFTNIDSLISCIKNA
jgi:hypothetical protein